MPPVGFEPTIAVGERSQTYALDRADTGTGIRLYTRVKHKSWAYTKSRTFVQDTAGRCKSYVGHRPD
jgi:hypothetical protein